MSVLADISSLDPGAVSWDATIIEHTASGSSTRGYSGHQEVKKSPMAGLPKGWSLVGVDRMVIDASGVSEVRGDGNAFHFPGTPWAGYTRSPGEQGFSTLVYNSGDSSLTRTAKDGSTAIYDSDGLLSSRTDRNGNLTSYCYTNIDRDGLTDDIDHITDWAGRVTQFHYTSDVLTSIEDASTGRVTTLAYDGGLLTSITYPDPDGVGGDDPLVVGYTYDSGRLTEIDRGGEVTAYDYNDDGSVASRTNADGSEESFGNITYLAIPAPGVGLASNNLAPLFYPADAVTTSTDVAGDDYSYRIDRFGNITEETDALGGVTTYTRNEEGLVTEMVTPDPDGAGALSAMTTTYTYDGDFNLTEIEYPDSTTDQWTWDSGLQLPLTHTDRNGHVTLYTYDGDGNLLTEQRVVGGVDGVGNSEEDDVVTTYTYTPAPSSPGDPPKGLVATIKDALDVETHFAYNEFGLVTSIVYAFGTAVEATVSYDYDADENLISVIDELGRETTYDYDLLGRMISMTLPDPDDGGALTSPVYLYAYDALDRQVAVTDPLGRVTQYVYNAAGQLTDVIAPDHDGDTNATVTSYVYDEHTGRLIETIDALGGSHTPVYDELGRVIESHEPDPTDDAVSNPPVTTYTYDKLGQMLTMADDDRPPRQRHHLRLRRTRPADARALAESVERLCEWRTANDVCVRPRRAVDHVDQCPTRRTTTTISVGCSPRPSPIRMAAERSARLSPVTPTTRSAI